MQVASRLLKGTRYEHYYGLPFDGVAQIADVQKAKHGAPTSPAFAALCSRLAGPGDTKTWSVANNGKVIEQEPILTTHNLAGLFAGLGLEDAIRGELPELARRCFTWVCRRQQVKRSVWKSQLQMMKNTAYAWRQMLFFLSVSPASVAEFVAWADEHFRSQSEAFRSRFAPAIRGLGFVAQGGRFDDAGHDAARRTTLSRLDERAALGLWPSRVRTHA